MIASIEAKEPWTDESLLYIPVNNLILIENGAGAESLASILLLNALKLKFQIKYAKNVSEMSPSGLKDAINKLFLSLYMLW